MLFCFFTSFINSVSPYSGYKFWSPLWYIHFILGECHRYLHLKENLQHLFVRNRQLRVWIEIFKSYSLYPNFGGVRSWWFFSRGGLCCVVLFFAYVLLVFVLRFACPMLPKILVYQFVVPPSMFSIVYMLCVNLFFPLTKTYPSATFWIKNCGLNQRRLCIAWYRVRIRPGFIR